MLTNFNSEQFKNNSNLTEQYFNKETINLEKSNTQKAQEFKKNELLKIENTESSIIESLINSEKDKQIFIEDKEKVKESHLKEKGMTIKNTESEAQILIESTKQLIGQLEKKSMENKTVVNNVNINIWIYLFA